MREVGPFCGITFVHLLPLSQGNSEILYFQTEESLSVTVTYGFCQVVLGGHGHGVDDHCGKVVVLFF